MKFDKKGTISSNNSNNLNHLITINSIIKHEEFINNYRVVKIPCFKIKEQILHLEKQLFTLMNIYYEKEIIY